MRPNCSKWRPDHDSDLLLSEMQVYQRHKVWRQLGTGFRRCILALGAFVLAAGGCDRKDGGEVKRQAQPAAVREENVVHDPERGLYEYEAITVEGKLDISIVNQSSDVFRNTTVWVGDRAVFRGFGVIPGGAEKICDSWSSPLSSAILLVHDPPDGEIVTTRLNVPRDRPVEQGGVPTIYYKGGANYSIAFSPN